MGSEVDQPEPISTPKLPPLLIIPPESSPEDQSVHFHTKASIPFLWEEEPGKPIATVSSDHTNNGVPNKSCLDLHPRLQSTEYSKTTKVSPNTVLDGPYAGLMQINIVQGVSFGFKRERRREGSAGDSYSVGSPERGQLGYMVLIGKRGGERKESRGGLFGSFGWRRSTVGRKEGLGGGGPRRMIRSSSMGSLADSGGGRSRWEPFRKIRKIESFSGLSEASRTSRSKFWATIYEGFRQVLPWKGRQAKNKGLTT